MKTINLGNQVNGAPLKASMLDTLSFTSQAPYTDSYSFTIARKTPIWL